ncbi:neuropeptide CCHamide-2 receptor-like [Homalodisca vitripennis]|uniref:neuropeptide CCHamide-2 receptor-like n=1 Tax=Homalodisca vitripennis TaxID=197043 RepID=UPI001EEBAB37|nr:neuropeptide CCHamide-2 receptor-like [Homalodisca vitripennis]
MSMLYMPPYQLEEHHLYTTATRIQRHYEPRLGYSAEAEAEESYVPHPHTPLFYVKFLVQFVVLVMGLVGNALTIFIFVRHRKIRSATNTYIISIAVTDLLVTITCPLVMIVMDLAGTWSLGAVTCKFSQATMEFSTCATVLTLTAVSVERYYAIVHPIERYLSTQRFTIVANLLVWMVAVLVSIPKFVSSGIRQEQLNGTRGYTIVLRCAFVSESPAARYFSLTQFIMFYVIPFFVVVSMYRTVSRRLLENSRQMFSRLSTAGQLRQANLNSKVVMMVKVLSAIFFVSFLPYNVLRLKIYFGGNEKFWNTAASYAYCFGCLHFWLNPIAMYLLCDTFRQYYNQYLFCCFFRWKTKDVVTPEEKDGNVPPDTTVTNLLNSDTMLQNNDTDHHYETIEIRTIK